MDDSQEPKRTMTREELHELVWSMPMQKLALQYGLSDKGLAKTCAKHLVPVPPRGYWAKLEAGQSVKKTKLRNVENNELHTVHIGLSQRRMSDAALSMVVAAKAEKAKQISERNKQPRPVAPEPAPIEEPGETPHQSIAAVAKQIRKAKADAEGVVHAPGITVHDRSRERAVTIMHNLAKVCDGKSVSLSIKETWLTLKYDVGTATISLSEERRRIKHEPTAAEMAEYERLKAKRERERARSLWSFGRIEPWPEFDIVYTGKLTLAYEGWTPGIRKSWSDGRTQRVEGILQDFVDGVRLIITTKAEEDRIQAEKNRRRDILRHRRELAAKRATREVKRLEFLKAIADARREVSDLKATIGAIPRASDLSPEYQKMIEWAELRLEALEAKTAVQQIHADIVALALFPEPDELHDPEGDPPPQKNYWDD